MGMDLEDLQRAVQLAAPPPDTSGRGEFGMGMKTSCCWLGDHWKIITKKLGVTPSTPSTSMSKPFASLTCPRTADR